MRPQASAINLEDFRVPDDRLTCAPFDLTEDTAPLGDDVLIGQERAEAALRKGFATPDSMFVVGLGSVNSAFFRNLQGKANASMPADKVCDTVSVRSLENLGRFRFIDLQKGQAIQFQQDMVRLLEALQESIPALFEKESFREAESEIRSRALGEIRDIWSALEKEEEASTISSGEFGELGFVHQINPTGVSIYPVMLEKEGKPLDTQEYQSKLDESEREKLDDLRNRIMEMLQGVMADVRKRESEAEEEVEILKRQSVEPLFAEKTVKILSDYGKAAVSFIDGLRECTLMNLNAFQPRGGGPFPPELDVFLPFKVDVFVDNSKTEGVPVIEHRNASYEDIFGRVKTVMRSDGIPRVVEVEAGLLSKANHGVLVLSAQDIFSVQASMWGVWERLKAVLETKRLDIHSTRLNWYGTENTTNTSLETLHVDVKLVLVGSEFTYRMLNSHPDVKNDFDEVFKTVVYFDSVAPRSSEVVGQLKGLIGALCTREHLPPVEDDAVGVFLRYLSRRVADQNKFRLDARAIKDILAEAAWISREEAGDEKDSVVITEKHVRQTIHDREYRVSLMRDKIFEFIEEGTIFLSLEGSAVGQVNALAVFDLGDILFGRPSRITVRTFAGRAGIVNIERESRMSGSNHDKGVLILSGYLGGKFAQERPLTLSATLAFEQSYEGTDGDSASSPELYAILSSLSGVPLRQNIAVTGSVNQNGEIQPIGGVNQKVEGMFDVCSAFGLTGDQGVMIPYQNIKNLVLRDDVVEAIKEGKFHIYAVRTIEEGIAVLTGMEAGECDDTGKYPEGTLNRLVDDRLKKLAKTQSFWQRLFGG